jgi:hypothetical protein
MDGLRLIRITRHALAEARSVRDVLVESWQACQVVEAVGNSLAAVPEARGRPSAAAAERAAGHAADRAGRPPSEWTGAERAGRLTEVADPRAVVEEARRLLREVAEVLIVLACGADEQELYWRCIDAVDATAECKELATDLLRALGGKIPADGPDGPDGPDGTPETAEETAVLELPGPPPG